jgi:acetyltransferase
LSPQLRAQLDALLPGYASSANPVDITPVWSRFAELYPAVCDLLARSGEVDLVVPVLLHRSAESEEVANALVATMNALRVDGISVPIYVCWVARRSAWPIAARLQQRGIPCLEWPARTARAIGHAVRYGVVQRRANSIVDMPACEQLPPDVGRDAKVTATFLRSHGIPVVHTQVCSDVDAAVAAAEALGYPVVAKVDHPDLIHKSDVGGVRLGLSSAHEVRAAVVELLALAHNARVLIQPQSSGLELVVGGLREPTLGPVVAFGLGGVLVEVLDDVAFAAAPLSHDGARVLMSRVRASALLDGVRGSSPVDRDAVAAVVQSTSMLMVRFPEIAELDLNPLLVTADGVVVVDARLIRE